MRKERRGQNAVIGLFTALDIYVMSDTSITLTVLYLLTEYVQEFMPFVIDGRQDDGNIGKSK